MRIPPRQLEVARNRSVISYLMSSGFNGVFKNPHQWVCKSPLRPESSPSFSVRPDRNVWFDFGLGEGGDIIKLVMLLQGIKFQDAVQQLAGLSSLDKAEIPLPKTDTEHPVWQVPPDTGQSERGKRTVEKYFHSLGIPYYQEMRAFPLTYKGVNYIGIPCPDPIARLGLECRGFELRGGMQPVPKRMTMGHKLPWVMRRRPDRWLVTESITDALAGEVILSDATMSLCALNGIGNIKKLPEYLPAKTYVTLAMDNDGDANGRIGQKMQQEAEKILLDMGCRVSFATQHIIAGEKDFLRLLQKQRTK